jgi:tetratricopeptide (TPR) repeat protein
MSLAERGDFAPALAHAAEAIEIAEAVANPLDVCDACFAAASVHLRQGAPDEARAALDRGRLSGERGDLPVELALLTSGLGYACALAGRPGEAVPLLERASREIAATGLRLRDALRATWLGEAYLLAGRLEDAARVAGDALDLARRHAEQGVEAWAERLHGEVASQRAPLRAGEAGAHYRRALRLADTLGMQPLRAHCLLGLGRLHRRTGEAARARAELAEARAALRSMAMTLWLPLTETARERSG